MLKPTSYNKCHCRGDCDFNCTVVVLVLVAWKNLVKQSIDSDRRKANEASFLSDGLPHGSRNGVHSSVVGRRGFRVFKLLRPAKHLCA